MNSRPYEILQEILDAAEDVLPDDLGIVILVVEQEGDDVHVARGSNIHDVGALRELLEKIVEGLREDEEATPPSGDDLQ